MRGREYLERSACFPVPTPGAGSRRGADHSCIRRNAHLEPYLIPLSISGGLGLSTQDCLASPDAPVPTQ